MSAFVDAVAQGLFTLDLNDVVLSEPGGGELPTVGIFDATVRVIPEPSSVLLLGLGLSALTRGSVRLRRRRG